MKPAFLCVAAAALTAALLPAAEPTRGARAYAKCYACHSLEAGESVNGPSLHAIVGKAIAADPDFPYSPALRRLAARERIWTPQLLDRFIADPEGVAPGTDMGFFARTDPRDRAAIIGYLASEGRRRR